MDEASFEKQLNDLVSQIGPIPEPQRNRIILLARRTQESQKKLQKSMDHLQSSLDYLRVCVKYMMFDLEATRRENKILKQMLEDQS